MRSFFFGALLVPVALLCGQVSAGRNYDQPPILVHKVEPLYSLEAQAARYEGRALLEAVVDISGMPTAIKVLSPVGMGLDQMAIECVQQWRFKPGLKSGNPVPVKVSLEINFRMAGSKVSASRFAKLEATRTQYNLGVAALSGKEGSPDYAKALKAFREPADDGYALAQLALAKMYLYGTGVQRDPQMAAVWCLKAARQGLPEAQFLSGLMAARGDGVTQDSAGAVDWYRKSAAQGHAKAQLNLGLAYEKGDGVKQDLAQALKLIRKSAEQGLAQAQYWLGLRYRDGSGVPKNGVTALVWFTASATQSFAAAAEERSKLMASLTVAEVAKAEQLARSKLPAR